MTSKHLNILILHLDLGIGGAEQLIVNMGRLLKESGHSIYLLTTHHNKNHCFEETKPNGYLGNDVMVYGDWLPRQILGKFTAFCAVLRMIYLTIVVLLFYRSHTDVIVLDGVSAPVPLLRWFGLKVLFYCHFPDLLLCTERKSSLKRLYRTCIDKMEEFTTAQANIILVNSKFTATVFHQTFPSISKKRVPQILYPVIRDPKSLCLDRSMVSYCKDISHIFVSLNRFERKKKIETAIGAMKVFKSAMSKSDSSSVLVVAGGYDEEVTENVEYLQELQAYCDSLGLTYIYLPYHDTPVPCERYDVIFRTSISSVERTALFLLAAALLYTPDKEHFGIVPLEAMQVGLPVVAVNSGGPTETVSHLETGFLCNQDPDEFGSSMIKLLSNSEDYHRMKEAAKQRVKALFSEEVMKKELNKFVYEAFADI